MIENLIQNAVVLTNCTLKGHLLQATFLPKKGMNLISFKCDDVEVIDQSTRHLFDERSAGLGPLIGPHFHERSSDMIPFLTEEQEQLFPHIARMKAQGRKDPFSHGIGRYAPWHETHNEDSIHAVLTGKDLWNGIPLSTLEGQNFSMHMDARLTPAGLDISLSVVSDTHSLVGIHYYYALPEKEGVVTSDVHERYYDPLELKKIPPTWNYEQHLLTYDLKEAADFAFHPFHDPLCGTITLYTSEYRLITTYKSMCQEHSWQLYHPKNASFVCIEPISAQNPRKANFNVSAIHVHLEVEPGERRER